MALRKICPACDEEGTRDLLPHEFFGGRRVSVLACGSDEWMFTHTFEEAREWAGRQALSPIESITIQRFSGNGDSPKIVYRAGHNKGGAR